MGEDRRGERGGGERGEGERERGREGGEGRGERDRVGWEKEEGRQGRQQRCMHDGEKGYQLFSLFGQMVPFISSSHIFSLSSCAQLQSTVLRCSDGCCSAVVFFQAAASAWLLSTAQYQLLGTLILKAINWLIGVD